VAGTEVRHRSALEESAERKNPVILRNLVKAKIPVILRRLPKADDEESDVSDRAGQGRTGQDRSFGRLRLPQDDGRGLVGSAKKVSI
jgi:hypothetical protein